MSKRRKRLIQKCKQKLIDLKNKYHETLRKNSHPETSAEIIDNASRELQMQNSLYFRSRIRKILPEIELALNRIAFGTYGVCEVSGIDIEEKRLLAVPWTRVSKYAIENEL